MINKLQIVLLLFTWLAFETADAQNIKIITQNKMSLPGALVKIKSLKTTHSSHYITGNKGIANITDLHPEDFPCLLTVTHIGYLTHTDTLHHALPGVIQLAAKPSTLDPVIVTGQYYPTTIRNSVYKISVIGAEEIEARAPVNVQQVLNNELGIHFSSDPALGISDISLMGMGGRNIKILLDGVPLLDRGDVRESLNQLDVAQIKQIEIIEGPMSTMYGSDALAGVINIITKTPYRNTLNINARIHEESAGNEYKLLGTKGLHSQQAGAAWSNGRFNALINMAHYHLNGFGADAYGRAHKWKPKEQWLPSVRLGFNNEKWSVFYRNDYLYEIIQNLGPVNTETLKMVNKDFITSKMGHQLQSQVKLNNKWSWNNAISLTNYTRHTETKIVNLQTKTIIPATGAGEQDTAKYNSFSNRSAFQYAASNNLILQPGFEINRDAASGARITGAPFIMNYALFFSFEYKPTHRLNLRPGFRLNKNTRFKAPPFIPSFNLLFNLNDNYDFRGAYARGYRAPALRELYFNFQDANHNLKGNTSLKAENSHNLNVSINYHRNLSATNFSSEIGYFFNVYNNLIDFASNPNNVQEYIYVNIEKYKTTGVSINNTFKSKNIEAGLGGLLLGQYNKLSNDDTFNNNKLKSFFWTPEVNLSVLYHIQKTKTSLNLFYKFSGQKNTYQAVTGSSGTPAISIAKRESFHFADFNLRQQMPGFLSLQAGVRNLFNIKDIRQSGTESGSAHSPGAAVPISYGRSYFLSLLFNFNKNLNPSK